MYLFCHVNYYGLLCKTIDMYIYIYIQIKTDSKYTTQFYKLFVMVKNLTEKIPALENVTNTLENMKKGISIPVPNYQRVSINGTIQRLKDTSSRRYSCKRINDTYFTIKRIR